MINRSRLLGIEDLKIATRMMQMKDLQLEEYGKELDRFVDDFPRIEAEIREGMAQKDANALCGKILVLHDDLLKIGADDIAAECVRYVNSFKMEQYAKFEAYVGFLLSQLAALSIDIQMALFADEERHERIVPASQASSAPSDAPPTHTTISTSGPSNTVKSVDDALATIASLTAANPAAAGAGAAAAPAPAPAPTPPTKLILAVDDDPQCLDVFKLALKDVSCRIIAVTSGAAAINILATQAPDLLVFDIDMPVMDGLTLAKNVRSVGCETPIIFITGNAGKDMVVKALMAGGNDFILKPINPQNVVERITRFV